MAIAHQHTAGFKRAFMEKYTSGTLLWPRHLGKTKAFQWEYQGHDPRNHRGRFTHPYMGYRNYSLIILDDISPSYDPRNHNGAQL